MKPSAGTPSKPPLRRRVAGFLIRGRDAPYILADLDEAFERDLAGGRSKSSAWRRYAMNVVGSTLSTWRRRRWLPSAGLWLDAKLGARMLRKQPVLTGVAALTLALGIPAALFPLHVMDSITAPLPVEDGDRVVGVWNWDVVGSRMVTQSIHDWVRWRETLDSFEDLGIGRSSDFNVVSGDGRAAPIRGAEVSASVFSLLRVPPILGRLLSEADEVVGAPDVVVIGHDLWQSRLVGDPDVVGTSILVGGVPRTVVGVMPEGFLFPQRDHLWLPFRYNPFDYAEGDGPNAWIMGRLADGVTLAGAQAELDVFGQRMALEYPDTHGRLRPRTLPFTEAHAPFLDTPGSPDFYYAEFLALALLALACANVGILILARVATRTREIAIRTALGAGRARIVTQIFVESLVLAVGSAGIGLLMGQLVAGRFQMLMGNLPYWVDFGITPRAIMLAMSLAVVSALIAGAIPALKATGKNVQNTIQRTASGASGIRFGFASNALIVAQVVVAVLCIGMGTSLLPTVVNESGGLGLEADQFLSAALRIPQPDPGSIDSEATRTDFQGRLRRVHEELSRRLAAEPGVGSVAIASSLPGMSHARRRIEVEGEPLAPGSLGYPVHSAQVDIGYFDALEQPIHSGRGFSTADLGDDGSAVIVNATFVENVLRGRQPIGQRVRYAAPPGNEPGPWYEIVGVVGHLGMNALNPDLDEGLYHPAAPGTLYPVRFAIRVASGPSAFVPRLRAIVAEIDAGAMIQDPLPLDEVPNYNRFLAVWGGVAAALLSAITVLLSAAGLYALMSFTVAQRTREIGIRCALGARPASIVATIARRASLQLMTGVTIGAALTSLLLRGIEPGADVLQVTDWQVAVPLIALGVVLVGLLACVPPTRRGLRVLPVDALKS